MHDHLPHLTAKEGKPPDVRVGQSIEGDTMRPARVVGGILLLLDPLVPDVPIAIQSAAAMPVDDHILTAENKSSRLVLIPNIEGIFEPVLDISAKLWQCE